MNFDDLYNKLKSLEIDIKGGSSYNSTAPTHSTFVSTTSTNNKLTYADIPSSSSSVSYTFAVPRSHSNSGNVMEEVLHSFVAESEPQQKLAYEDFDQIGKIDLEELDIIC